MAPPSDPQTAALLAHVFQQTQANVSFLAAQNFITPIEASEIMSRLTTAQSRGNNTVDDSLASSIQSLNVSPVDTGRRNVPPPPARRTVRARALWAYNEDGREPNDLSFSSGEIVEIVDETNTDWWTGRCRGRQGLFPSNHVEKLDGQSAPISPPVPAPMPSMQAMSPPPQPMVPYSPQGPGPQGYQPNYMDEKNAYRPYGSSYPPPAPVAAPVAPAPVQPPVVVQQAPPPPKKHRFGNLGNTMANAAAGGVGFGAGAAIGSGIVDAIF